MAKKTISPEKFIPFMNKKIVFKTSWGLKDNNPDNIEKLEAAFTETKKLILESDIKGTVYSEIFNISSTDTTITFDDHGITWEFPTVSGKNIASSAGNKLALQVVTVGKEALSIYEKMEKDGEYSRAFYFHGFTTWMAEALAEYNHNTLRNELGSRKPPERYSFGYSLCPDMSMQIDLFKMLKIDENSEITLTENYMMFPEQSTSALILW